MWFNYPEKEMFADMTTHTIERRELSEKLSWKIGSVQREEGMRRVVIYDDFPVYHPYSVNVL